MFRNDKGFTLIETLISLAIVATLSIASFPFVVQLFDYMQLNQVITVLQSDLHYLRDMNMMQLDDAPLRYIRIYHDEQRYVLIRGEEIEFERFFPSTIQIPHSQPISIIRFNSAGNLGQGRTLQIESNHHQRQFVFSVGMGGFDVR